MPKPLERLPGSALHLHLSLLEAETGRNAFFAEGASLSELGNAFPAGLLRHARELTAVTNQWLNSYKRLAAGFEAPYAICWSQPPSRQPRATIRSSESRARSAVSGGTVTLCLPSRRASRSFSSVISFI